MFGSCLNFRTIKTRNMALPRLKRSRSVAVYVGTFLLLLFLTDLLFQYAAIRRSTYLRATDNVLAVVHQISDMEKSVLPSQSTVILEPSPSTTCHQSGNGLFLLFVVISAPENIQRRDVIRTTFNEMRPRWKEQFAEMKAKSTASETDIRHVFQLLFFVGQSTEDGMSDEVRREWDRHGDVIVDDFEESYLKLTVKTLRMLKWVLRNCVNAKYLVKMDDDVFVNVPKLFSFLLDQPSGYNPSLIAGHVYQNFAPDRDPTSKWFIPRSLLGGEKLPNFIGGFCYVLGLKAAQGLFEESRNMPLLHLEDVFLTGIVASSRLNYELTDPGGVVVTLWYYFHLLPSSWLSEYLIVHDVPSKSFRCWTRITGRTEKSSWIENYWPLYLSCL